MTDKTETAAPKPPGPMSDNPGPAAAGARTRLTARALLLGERIDTAGLERSDVIATTPLAFRVGTTGYAVLFRFGVAVLIGMSPVEEDDVLRALGPRIVSPFDQVEDEATVIDIVPDRDEHVTPGGQITIRELSAPHLLVIADALAKNVALARDEREIRKVIEVVEPFAAQLARTGRSPSNRRQILSTIGQALLAHHRLSGRVEVVEKPDILWDHPEFERLYARLADDYELKERVVGLERKLRVIDETARALTEIMDAHRATRLEATIVALIVVEVLVTFYQLFSGLLK